MSGERGTVMAEYVISELAANDLREIADYTRRMWSEEQAERYLRMLFGELARLAECPFVGRSYDEYRVGLRGRSCGKHVVLYRVLSRNKVRIVRVLHKRMDLPRHL